MKYLIFLVLCVSCGEGSKGLPKDGQINVALTEKGTYIVIQNGLYIRPAETDYAGQMRWGYGATPNDTVAWSEYYEYPSFEVAEQVFQGFQRHLQRKEAWRRHDSVAKAEAAAEIQSHAIKQIIK